jgi:hypothetical protein
MKHKHADLIHAWADGAQIQSRNDISGSWEDNRLPMWAQDTMYRIKPMPKPDVVQERCIAHWTGLSTNLCPNIRLVFDGETGKLKSAEVI